MISVRWHRNQSQMVTPGPQVRQFESSELSEVQTEVWYPPALCRASLYRSTDGRASCEVQIMSPNILTFSVFCRQYELWNCRKKATPRNGWLYLLTVGQRGKSNYTPSHHRAGELMLPIAQRSKKLKFTTGEHLPVLTANLGRIYMLCKENKFLWHVKSGIQGNLAMILKQHTVCILISVVLLCVLKKHIYAVSLGTEVPYSNKWENPTVITSLFAVHTITTQKFIVGFWGLYLGFAKWKLGIASWSPFRFLRYKISPHLILELLCIL